jgi:hypothetical protein
MKKTEAANILLTLCNSVLLKDEQVEMPSLSPKEWNDILSLAAEQGTLPVIAPLLTDLNLEDDASRMMMVQWYAIAQQDQQRYAMRLKTMQYLAKIFGQDGIDVMFMKGAALAQLYPEPTWRVFSDIDYYLFEESEHGNEVLKKHLIESSAYYHHHTQASLNGILLENHYDFVERVNHRCDIKLDDALKVLAEKEGRSVKASFLGDDITNAYVMTPTMNAIFLMRHMSAHFVGETIPLRMLYDWALFLKHQAQDVDWQLVTELYDKSGMTEFAGLIQCLLKTKLGVEYAECPVFSCNEEKADKLWQSIIFPPEQDPYKKYSLKYYIFEAKTFWKNRWKHKIVYPGESYAWLFCKYAWLGTKKMLGLLK